MVNLVVDKYNTNRFRANFVKKCILMLAHLFSHYFTSNRIEIAGKKALHDLQHSEWLLLLNPLLHYYISFLGSFAIDSRGVLIN